ncbi:hypothetical protein [Planotetraspora mira]|uniref:Secreted protein n=1 Tax=Planotetraspora mira TaxID=58121 RepID=A0A8J3XBC8_9ACTN|nr:hypothetical protein [Planotetraspora mira]GII34912.1 hypothetical protein Pmi06nite_83540 [Planotetraspora mira]
MRMSRLAALATAAAVTGITPFLPAVQAVADTGEVTVVLTQGKSLYPQTEGYLLQKCPSTAPYVVSAGGSAATGNSSDHKFGRYDNIYTTDDGRSVRMNIRNTQTLLEAGKSHHDVVLSYNLTITCSNVNHGKPQEYGLSTRSFLPLHGEATLASACPTENHTLVLRSTESHGDGTVVTDRQEGLHTDSYTFQHDDDYVMGWAVVTVYCG